jgi:hypothetical protein
VNAMLADAIPIYWGPPISDYFNKDALIDCTAYETVSSLLHDDEDDVKDTNKSTLSPPPSFPTMEALMKCAQEVIRVDSNDTLYENMLRQPRVKGAYQLNRLFKWHPEVKDGFESAAQLLRESIL